MSNDVRPLSRRRDEGERRKKIYEPRDRRRVSLCRSSRRARARRVRPSIHRAGVRAVGRSECPFVSSPIAAVSYLRRARGCRALLPGARVVFSDGWDTFERYTYTKPSPGRAVLTRRCRHLTSTPGGLTTSGDSRKSISNTRARTSRARARGGARSPSVAGGGVEKISSRVRRGKGDRPVARARAIAIARASSWLRARWAGWTRWTGWGGRSRIHTRSSRARRRRR